ncbi:Stf0 family sulfotransferase [Oceaniglobus trochenteri]|uniref:Stf0 family sulfotransferase n=1 Tax=Oceaniglobus trochenteri TaxID=2763260 RepID=UPI001CFFD6C6|nr:Stf0 family sulfotransferase [Oceaniglobus trochenteri]
MKLPYWLRPRWSDFGRADTLDRARFAQDMALPLPDLQYVMFFTPRSGSSWVADILTRTRRMGRVSECFNPRFMGSMTRSLNATSLGEYCAVLPRRLQTDGTFGFQITQSQKRAVFGRDRAFLNRFAGQPWVWLIRSDIVLQAVSLYKMEVGRMSHAPQMKGRDIKSEERALPYDAGRIGYWLEHILQMERKTEALIAKAGITPLRLNYERNALLKPNHIANVIGRHIGRPTMRMTPIASPHSKIGTDQNAAFAERFRDSHRDRMKRIEDERADMVENSVCYGPKGSFPDA